MKTTASRMRIFQCMSSPLPRSYGARRMKMRTRRRTTAFVGERRGGAGNVEWMADGGWQMAMGRMADGGWRMAMGRMADGGWQMAEEMSDVRRQVHRHPPSAIRHLVL